MKSHHPLFHPLAACLLTSLLISPVQAESETGERLQALERRLNQLENENRALKLQASQTEQKIEATGAQIDRMAGSQGGTAKAASTIGGYGELHLNRLKNQKPGGTDKDEIDFHRFVLFVGHEFNQHVRLFSELEVEHALVKDSSSNGSTVAVEQAYLDFILNEQFSLKAGLMVVPVGILSETHEPPTFYGVERNPVETNIIPTTWREGGVALNARMAHGFSADFALTSGLATTSGNNYRVRDGRTHTANARASDAAYTARLKWSGVPGVELAATVNRQSDITQSIDPAAGAATLYETHAVVNRGAFGLRALYAAWHLNGNGPKAIGADRQNGWYVEPSWKFNDQWGVFARHNRWDNAAGDAANSRFDQTDVGVNYWPHPDVVVKLDFQNQKVPVGQNEFDGFNLGLGYQF